MKELVAEATAPVPELEDELPVFTGLAGEVELEPRAVLCGSADEVVMRELAELEELEVVAESLEDESEDDKFVADEVDMAIPMVVEVSDSAELEVTDEVVVDKTVEDEVNEAVSVVVGITELVELEVSPEETAPLISILSDDPDLSE